MTLISAEKWKTLKIITIELPSAVENLQSTPTSLPTSEPAESQISITLAEADLPVVKLNGSPNIPTITYTALVYAGGKNTDAASQTVYWRMLKNGSSLSNGSFSVSADYYWTITAGFFDVNAGDTIELRLWASSTNVNWDYDAHVCQCTRLFPYASGISKVLWVQTKDIVEHPTLSSGNPSGISYKYYLVNPQTNYTLRETIDTEYEHVERWRDFIFQAYLGDYTSKNNAMYRTSSTYRPYYNRNYLPTKILIRELR